MYVNCKPNQSYLIPRTTSKSVLYTYEVLNGFVLHHPVVAAPALGAGTAVEEHVFLAGMPMVIAVHKWRFLPYAN